MDFGKPSKALEYANSLKIPFVVFIGQEEVGKKKYKLKNMETGEEKLLSDKPLVKALGKWFKYTLLKLFGFLLCWVLYNPLHINFHLQLNYLLLLNFENLLNLFLALLYYFLFLYRS